MNVIDDNNVKDNIFFNKCNYFIEEIRRIFLYCVNRCIFIYVFVFIVL